MRLPLPAQTRKSDPELDLVRAFWRMVQEEQQYCESRHCTGGRSACLRLKDKIETHFSEILLRGRTT